MIKSMENPTPICYNAFRGILMGVDVMGFKIGTWLHDAPDTGFDASGKQAIVKHLCFGPLETRIWYKLIDGRYCREIHFIEGLQEGERYTDFISKSEMLEVLDNEIALCEKYGETNLTAQLHAEREKINLS